MTRVWIVLVFLAIGCKSDSVVPTCKDTSWLTAIETGISQSGMKGDIHSYYYKGALVFEINPGIAADNMITVNDCSGTIICQFGGLAGFNTCPDFYTTATNKKLIWNN